MLQCTAVTDLPISEALAALIDMEGGPGDAHGALAQNRFLLCELGEHDESTEHAAHLWTAEAQAPGDLWFLWAGSGAHRVHRFARLPLCLAVLRDFDQGSVQG